jgi:hypothetical protein
VLGVKPGCASLSSLWYLNPPSFPAEFVAQVGKTEGDPEPAILSDAQLTTLQARCRSLSVADLSDKLDKVQENLVFEAIAVLTGSLLKSGRVDGFLNPLRIEQHAALLLAILTSSPALEPVLQEVSRDAKCLELLAAATGNGSVVATCSWRLLLLVAEQRKGFPLLLKLIPPVLKQVFTSLSQYPMDVAQTAFALLSRLAHVDEKLRRSFVGQLVAVVTTSPPADSVAAMLKAEVMNPSAEGNRLGTCQDCHAELVAKLGAFCPKALADYMATGKDDESHASSAPAPEAGDQSEETAINGGPAPPVVVRKTGSEATMAERTGSNPGFTAIGSRAAVSNDKDDKNDSNDNAEEESDMDVSDDEEMVASISTPTTLKGASG